MCIRPAEGSQSGPLLCPGDPPSQDTADGDGPIVVVNGDQPLLSRADWFRALEADGPTDVDADAAEIVGRLRKRCEGADADRP